ncbi:MAG: hypothetical protein ABSH31_21180 [Bryobacteraceae bacterium]|jgi:hypothetical protein
MKINYILGPLLGLSFLACTAGASTVPLDVKTYNFQLDGGGGGATATLNGVSVEIFCDNFYNDMYVPSTDSANVTTLGSSANLGETRFGDVSSSQWTAISLTGGGVASTDDTFFNSGAGSSASARYDMVAYLVSQYNVAQGNTAANNGIQEAIWTLMDPTAEGAVIDPSGSNPTSFLEQAASWYLGGGATNAFLSQFQVVSDATMTIPRVGVGTGGFQEQIVFTPTPEPRGSIWMLLGLFGVAGFLLQRSRARKFAPVI